MEAQKAKLHEEAKEKTAALAARAKAEQEVKVFVEVEPAEKAGSEAKASAKASNEAECKENGSNWTLQMHALKQQKMQLEEDIRAAATQAMKGAEAEADEQKAMAQAAREIHEEKQKEEKAKKMREAEELHALQLEVEALRKNQARAPPAPIMVPSSTLYMIDGSPKQRALAEAQAAERENREFQVERKEKELHTLRGVAQVEV